MAWYLCSGVYIDELVEPVEPMEHRLAFAALCILIFAVCVSLWYSRTLLQPINGVIGATERVIDGKYDVQIIERPRRRDWPSHDHFQ